MREAVEAVLAVAASQASNSFSSRPSKSFVARTSLARASSERARASMEDMSETSDRLSGRDVIDPRGRLSLELGFPAVGAGAAVRGRAERYDCMGLPTPGLFMCGLMPVSGVAIRARLFSRRDVGER